MEDKGFDISGQQFPKMKSIYPDLNIPITKAKLFAPGIVSKAITFEHTFISFTADMTKICWGHWIQKGGSKVFLMEKKEGIWCKETQLPFSASHPFVAPDGKRVFFTQKRKLKGGKKTLDRDIFYIELQPEGWGDITRLGPNVNTKENQGRFSVAKNNNIYYEHKGNIYMSKFRNGKYLLKEKLSYPVNTKERQYMAFIAQDESYILYNSNHVKGKRLQLYISFQKSEGIWTTPINLSEKYKLKKGLFNSISPDNKYIFYFKQDYYWQDAKGLMDLNRK